MPWKLLFAFIPPVDYCNGALSESSYPKVEEICSGGNKTKCEKAASGIALLDPRWLFASGTGFKGYRAIWGAGLAFLRSSTAPPAPAELCCSMQRFQGWCCFFVALGMIASCLQAKPACAMKDFPVQM